MDNKDVTPSLDDQVLRFLLFSGGLTMVFLSFFLIFATLIIKWSGGGRWLILVLLGGISFCSFAWEDEIWKNPQNTET